MTYKIRTTQALQNIFPELPETRSKYRNVCAKILKDCDFLQIEKCVLHGCVVHTMTAGEAGITLSTFTNWKEIAVAMQCLSRVFENQKKAIGVLMYPKKKI